MVYKTRIRKSSFAVFTSQTVLGTILHSMRTCSLVSFGRGAARPEVQMGHLVVVFGHSDPGCVATASEAHLQTARLCCNLRLAITD